MYKALALTALAGVASASKMWAYDVLPVASLAINDGNFNFLQMGLQVSFDTGYTTLYNNKMADPQGGQAYSLNIFSWTRATFYYQAFETYKANYDFTMKFLDFTPYGQVVTWTRPDNNNAPIGKFTVGFQGYRDLQIGDFSTRVRENAKTCKWSVFDLQD